ncbi:MAG: M1 family peptidase [Bacteroidia bacterium]|nr:M1 family peptidase [Bacteroidia bacterium]
MKPQLYLAVFSISLFFTSCELLKKNQTNPKNELPIVNLDTIQTTDKINEEKTYQASSKRINDIIHTKLDVSFDWAKQYLYGKATITAKPYFYPTSTIELDARGMELKEISLVSKGEKKNVKYLYENNVIAIQLDKEYKNNEQFILFIEYIAKPNELKNGGSAAITDDKGLYFINADGTDKNKPQQIWTQGETQASSAWFPTIDRPNERMTQEIYITVDKKYTSLSNGELVSSFDNGDGTKTDYWKMDLPHAPYLAMMAIGEFSVVKDQKWKDKEVSYYVEKEFEPHAKAIFGTTPEMLEFFSTKLGVQYPWNKYAQVVVRDYVSGAMENTTATLHGEFLYRTDRELIDKDNESIIAHELFHQWFGDLVTCESWSNLPLNESFATYGEYLWEEYKHGLDAADFHSAQSRAGYLAESSRKKENLIRFYYNDKEDMFDGHSYNKGGQVLHMLRKYVGDEAFFASLKLYLETNKFTSVEIHQLRLAFEQVTGEDLNWFFNQWFLSSGHPELIIQTNYDENKKTQLVKIKQTQDKNDSPIFTIPMYIDIYSTNKIERKKITLTKTEEIFEFECNIKPDLVNVDAEKMLLCTKYEKKSTKEYAFQYKHAPLYLDRYEALVGLSKNSHDSIASATIIAALNDRFWGIREMAISLLKDIPTSNESIIKENLISIAKNDKKSTVKADAIYSLSKKYNDEQLMPIYKNGLTDKSYIVVASSLSAISTLNPQEGLTLAKQYENEKNEDVLFAICDLYSVHGTDEQKSFFISVDDKFSVFSNMGFITLYTTFLKKGKSNETIQIGVNILASVAKDKSTSKWVAYYAKKQVKDLAELFKAKEDEESKIQYQKIMELYNSLN